MQLAKCGWKCGTITKCRQRKRAQEELTVPSNVPFRVSRRAAPQHLPTKPGAIPSPTMNSALDKLYAELLSEADKEEPEEITDAEKAKRFLAEKQITIEKLREVRVCLWLWEASSLSFRFSFRRSVR